MYLQVADYLVHSFMSSDIIYRVRVAQFKADALRGGDFIALITCSCPDYKLNEHKCKHLFLTARITGLPIRPPPRLPAPALGAPTSGGLALPISPSEDALPAPTLPPAGAISAEDTDNLKCVLIERIQKEVDALPCRAQRLSRMPLDKVSRAALLDLEVAATRLRWDFNSVLTPAPLYTFQM
jgi:hypothetical protein